MYWAIWSLELCTGNLLFYKEIFTFITEPHYNSIILIIKTDSSFSRRRTANFHLHVEEVKLITARRLKLECVTHKLSTQRNIHFWRCFTVRFLYFFGNPFTWFETWYMLFAIFYKCRHLYSKQYFFLRHMMLVRIQV